MKRIADPTPLPPSATPYPAADGFAGEPRSELAAAGAVSAHGARVWVRTPRRTEVVVRCHPADGPGGQREATLSLAGADADDGTAAVEVDGLAPLTDYRFEVLCATGALLGEGAFRTLPAGPCDAPDRFAIGIASCNMPFDDAGEVTEHATQMLEAARRCLEHHRVSFVLWMGDQMYADLPRKLSLYDQEYFARIAPPGRADLQDCTADEVRRIFQARYRRFWSVPGLQRLHLAVPGYPIWDDHEIVDNWGSSPHHATLRWRSIRHGAREAFFDYQASRVLPRTDPLPDAFDYTIDHGDVATLVLDLRSNRTGGPDGRIVSQAQLRRVEQFLADRADRAVLLFVLSVPLVHLPRWLAIAGARVMNFGEDFSDRWASPGHRRDRDEMLRILRRHLLQHPRQKIALLGGDIHVGCAHAIRWRGGPVLHQFISSALTNETFPMARHAAALLLRMNRRARAAGGTPARVRLLHGMRGHNPVLKLNFGILEFRRDDGGERQMRFRLYGGRDGEPYVAFETAWV